jgi:hypothetical protein
LTATGAWLMQRWASPRYGTSISLAAFESLQVCVRKSCPLPAV